MYNVKIKNITSEIESINDYLDTINEHLATYVEDDESLHVLNDVLPEQTHESPVSYWYHHRLYRINLDSNLYQWLLDWYGQRQNGEMIATKTMLDRIEGTYLINNELEQNLYIASPYATMEDVCEQILNTTEAKYLNWLNGDDDAQVSNLRRSWL